MKRYRAEPNKLNRRNRTNFRRGKFKFAGEEFNNLCPDQLDMNIQTK